VFFHVRMWLELCMKCDAYRILITGYIDEVLSENENRMLKEHLRSCEACLQHLKRQEILRTTLKRYVFLQDPPVVPSNFAQKVTARLQTESTPVFQPEGLRLRIRKGVLRVADAWSMSLKSRPFAWATAVSCTIMFLVGFFAINLFYAPTVNQMAQIETNVPVKQISPVALAVPAEPLPNVISDADNTSFFPIGFVEEEQPSVMPVQAQTPPFEGYVYSHVVGGYQERLGEDIMFVGYAQDIAVQ